AALVREHALAESRDLDAEALQAEAAQVHARCAAAAAAAGISAAPPPRPPATAAVYLDSARELLTGIDGVLAAQLRREELVVEERQLAITESALEQVHAEVDRCRVAVAEATRRLHGILAGAGLTPGTSPSE